MTPSARAMSLRAVLILAGIAIMYTGVNIAFGGIFTLGWQGSSDFAKITDVGRYLAQDSHVRFLGGIWLAVGTIFALSATHLVQFQAALKVALILTFIGGLARFSQMDLSVTFGPAVVGSLVAELIGMPLLYFWLVKTLSQREG